jgi:hypothetical protein
LRMRIPCALCASPLPSNAHARARARRACVRLCVRGCGYRGAVEMTPAPTRNGAPIGAKVRRSWRARACRYCGAATYLSDGSGPLHPCCAFWMEEEGRRSCVACQTSAMMRASVQHRPAVRVRPRRATGERSKLGDDEGGTHDRRRPRPPVRVGPQIRENDARDGIGHPGSRPPASIVPAPMQALSRQRTEPSCDHLVTTRLVLRLADVPVGDLTWDFVRGGRVIPSRTLAGDR